MIIGCTLSLSTVLMIFKHILNNLKTRLLKEILKYGLVFVIFKINRKLYIRYLKGHIIYTQKVYCIGI